MVEHLPDTEGVTGSNPVSRTNLILHSGSVKYSSSDASRLAPLLRLLDDDDPLVREMVTAQLTSFGGDISEILPDIDIQLSTADLNVLSAALLPVRREALREAWVAPEIGAAGIGDDWEHFESLLRLLSDFLHDGITIRLPLSDALDLIAEEARVGGIDHADDLRIWLFENGRFSSNVNDFYSLKNSDLAWVLDNGKSNPIGLSVVFLLIALRLDLEVEGVSFPGHFLARIYRHGEACIVDCYDRGKIFAQEQLLNEQSDLSAEQRSAFQSTADPGSILLRILNNLSSAFMKSAGSEDAALMQDLRRSLL